MLKTSASKPVPPWVFFLVRRVAWRTTGLKTKPVKGRMNFSCWDNDNLGQWVRLGSIAVPAASMLITRHRWTKSFLDWSRRSVGRLLPMDSTVKCASFQIGDIACRLTRRGTDSTRFNCPKHATHDWILSTSREVVRCSDAQRPYADTRSYHWWSWWDFIFRLCSLYVTLVPD